jgi:RbsD / FucU transport protein family
MTCGAHPGGSAVLAGAHGPRGPPGAAPPGTPVEVVERFAFHELARGRGVTLAVATGDQWLYANLLLTIGYIDPAEG